MGCLHTGGIFVNDGRGGGVRDHVNWTGVKGAGEKGRR